MNYRTLSDAEQQYIERMGLIWENEGLPRIAGRILGFLALQTDALTLDDIAGALQVSKASVSNDARLLERANLVARTSQPGDRRDYYAIAPDMPVRVIAQKLADLERLSAVMSAARDLPDTPVLVRERLGAFGEFHRRVIASLQELIATMPRDSSLPPYRPIIENL